MRALARALVRLFYHRVDVVGIERVPTAGPLVIVANHRNALVDPLILIATLPRTLRPMAKAPLFRHPILAPFLRLAGALPVHRRQDPGSDPARTLPCSEGWGRRRRPPEVRLASNRLVALVAPSHGGHLYELDVRAICHNLLATLTRREEAYHDSVRAGESASERCGQHPRSRGL